MSDLGYSNTTGASRAARRLRHAARLPRRARESREPAVSARTRRSARNATASGCRSTPTCCRSKTSSTRRSARSASRIRASVRCMRWPRAACNTSKCAAWISIRSSRPAFRWRPSRFLDAYLLVCALDDSRAAAAGRVLRSQSELRPRHRGRAQAGPRTDARRPTDRDDGLGRRTARKIELPRPRSTHCTAATRMCARVAVQRAKLADASLTPSARVLQTMRDKQQSFLAFGLEQSEAHAAYFRARPLDADADKRVHRSRCAIARTSRRNSSAKRSVRSTHSSPLIALIR